MTRIDIAVESGVAAGDSDAGKGVGAAAVKRDFHHPYTPYGIQETFMETLYQTIEKGGVGILESPTGTVSLYSSLRDFDLQGVSRDRVLWEIVMGCDGGDIFFVSFVLA